MNIKHQIARTISLLFHPLLIPTLGFLLLMNSSFYFALLTFQAKKYVLLVVFLSTFLLPLVSIGILTMNPRFDRSMDKNTDRIVPMLFSAIFYYMGYYYLGRIPIYPVYRVFLISSVLTIIILLIITLRWKISAHMAGIGGLIGAIIALSLRLGINSSLLLAGLIGVAGLVGSSRLLLGKHNPLQIYVGFFLGFAVNYLVLNYI
ncbi:phosphatase PAP2 family protein [Gaoshiqia sediminis]|uniref:Phosphatase PAP2 family protein n=1 Tax=Gaoshiqia sediminis TaxID=2986998 RepID=A0AA42CAB0_9BACT|nr:phosphatase PAP2 family protein [Gaoshiqia sediminis]MCW0483512.1 phosphatase PAP2 family protein [Gaoshiqia sediminis]